MKFSNLVALVGATQAMSKTEIAEVVGGFVEGALAEENLGDYITCTVTDAQIVEADFKDAVAEFKTKDIVNIVAGIEDIAGGLETVVGAYKLCTSVKNKDQLTKVEGMLKNLENPKTLIVDIFKNIQINGKDISGHIESAVTDFHASMYTKFGKSLGEAVAEVTLGKEEIELRETKVQEAFDITYGILMGAVKAEGLENMDKCFSGPLPIIDAVKDAVVDFEKKDLDDTIHGLQEIGLAVTLIASELQDCQGVVADWSKLEKMAAVFSSPASFAMHVGKDILLNGQDIYKQIEDAQSNYKTQQYEPFGEDIGHALAKVVLGDSLKIQEEFEAKKDSLFLF